MTRKKNYSTKAGKTKASNTRTNKGQKLFHPAPEAEPVVVSADKPAALEDDADNVVRLTETERLMFGKLDAELRNHIQAIRISELEYQNMQADFNTRLQAKQGEKLAILSALGVTRPQYDALVIELAEKYEIPDKEKMSIDPDTGVLRDLSVSED